MKIVTGTWTNPDGTVVADGRLFLKLSTNITTVGSLKTASTSLVSFQLDSTGSLPSGTSVLANDEIIPSGSYYVAAVLDSGGGLVWNSAKWVISGPSPVNLNNIIPV